MWLESIDKEDNEIPSPLNVLYYLLKGIIMIVRKIRRCLCDRNREQARIILRLQNVLVNTRIYASCCFSAMTGGL